MSDENKKSGPGIVRGGIVKERTAKPTNGEEGLHEINTIVEEQRKAKLKAQDNTFLNSLAERAAALAEEQAKLATAKQTVDKQVDSTAYNERMKNFYAALKLAFEDDLTLPEATTELLKKIQVLDKTFTAVISPAHVAGEPVTFVGNYKISNEAGLGEQPVSIFEVTKDSIESVGDNENFGPLQALEMVALAALDKSMLAEGIELTGTPYQKALIEQAIKDHNSFNPKARLKIATPALTTEEKKANKAELKRARVDWKKYQKAKIVAITEEEAKAVFASLAPEQSDLFSETPTTATGPTANSPSFTFSEASIVAGDQTEPTTPNDGGGTGQSGVNNSETSKVTEDILYEMVKSEIIQNGSMKEFDTSIFIYDTAISLDLVSLNTDDSSNQFNALADRIKERLKADASIETVTSATGRITFKVNDNVPAEETPADVTMNGNTPNPNWVPTEEQISARMGDFFEAMKPNIIRLNDTYGASAVPTQAVEKFEPILENIYQIVKESLPTDSPITTSDVKNSIIKTGETIGYTFKNGYLHTLTKEMGTRLEAEGVTVIEKTPEESVQFYRPPTSPSLPTAHPR